MDRRGRSDSVSGQGWIGGGRSDSVSDDQGRGEIVGIGAIAAAAGDGGGGTEAVVKQKGVGSSQVDKIYV